MSENSIRWMAFIVLFVIVASAAFGSLGGIYWPNVTVVHIAPKARPTWRP